MSNLLNAIKVDTNYTLTENGAVTHKTTFNKILDLFALGGAYRHVNDKRIEELFGDAYREDKDLALKCLFYLRDCRGGQGQRRFFRVAYKWLIRNDETVAEYLLPQIPTYGRFDDLIDVCYGTPIAEEMASIVWNILCIDECIETPTLLAKWMPSENASSAKTVERAKWFIKEFGITPKRYRTMLSTIRAKLKVLERTMSAKDWDDIEFDKIPSVAGTKYTKCFSTREELKERYAAFMANKDTKVNASVLNPVDIAHKILKGGDGRYVCLTDNDVNVLQKYWDNLKDYYCGREENAIAVVDVSGSMYGQPLEAAVGMGAYVAEKSHGPFAGHFITFSSRPKLVEFEGDNIVDKMKRCTEADWGGSTNIKATMDLILNTAIKNRLSQDDLPQRLYIFSDMEFNYAFNDLRYYGPDCKTLFENIEKKWAEAGYEMPHITFWNLDARQKNIPAIGDKFNYISGFSMSQMEAVMAGKTALDMMLEVLMNDRYKAIHS